MSAVWILLGAAIVLTLGLLGLFLFVFIRAANEERSADK